MKWLFLLIGFSPLLCATQSTAEELRLQLTAEPVSLDFTLAEDGVSFRVLSTMMAGLFRVDENGKLFPQIAESTIKTDQGRRLKIKLRPWKWSDGVEVQASDFVYAFQRALSPKVPSKLSNFLFFIKNARSFKTGSLKDFSAVGIRAISKSELEFTLEKPVGFFESILTLPLTYPQRAEFVDKWGASWVEHTAVTGGYSMGSWVRDQKIELVKNPYFQFKTVKPFEKLAFLMVPEESTALLLFEKAKLDVLFKVSHTDYEALDKKRVLKNFPYYATYYLAFNQKKERWQKVVHRRAIAQAFDRNSAVKVLGTDEYIASSWVPRGIEGFNPNLGIHFTAGEKKQSDVNNVKNLVLAYDSSPRNQLISERVQFELKKNAVIDVRLKTKEWKSYITEISALNRFSEIDVFRFGWLAPFPDAFASLMIFHSADPNNYTGWSNKRYDSLLAQIAEAQLGSEKRKKLVNEAQKILLEEEAVVIPLYHYTQTVALSKKVNGFVLNGEGQIDVSSMSASGLNK